MMGTLGTAGFLSGLAIVGIPIGIDPADAREKIEGFGFLVPRAEERGLLGSLHYTRQPCGGVTMDQIVIFTRQTP